jgi:hypothetical protein
MTDQIVLQLMHVDIDTKDEHWMWKEWLWLFLCHLRARRVVFPSERELMHFWPRFSREMEAHGVEDCALARRIALRQLHKMQITFHWQQMHKLMPEYVSPAAMQSQLDDLYCAATQ